MDKEEVAEEVAPEEDEEKPRVRTRRSVENEDSIKEDSGAEEQPVAKDEESNRKDDEEEEDEEEEEDGDDDIARTPSRGRRGRPPGSKNKATLMRELSSNLAKPVRGRRSGTASRRSTEEPSDNEGTAAAGEFESGEVAGTPAKRGRRGRYSTRGRGRGGPSFVTSAPLDTLGMPQEVLDDEIVLPEDAEGEKKVTRLGELTGGRQYRVRTFTVTGRGSRLYMLSTEPARCMGFRDSYLLFQKHKKLFKIIVNEEEKFDLIEREIIPHSYKGRAIGIVTARSVFREFGARIIVGGKKVIDDYYEQEAIDLGFVPGQIADPDDKLPPPGVPYNTNQYVAWHGASSVYHQYTQPQPTRETYKETYTKRKKIVVTDENWMLEHANAASTYNHEIMERRKRAWTSAGIYEPHTGVRFYPEDSQPKHARLVHVSTSVQKEELEPTAAGDKTSPRIVIETVMEVPNMTKVTGLKNVPAHIFETATPEIKAAILRQQTLENERY